MKTFLVTLVLVFIALQVKSQNEEGTHKISKKEVVINHSMVEKFNNYEYSDNQISFNDILGNYSFEDAKLIVAGYRNNELDLSSNDKITAYLSEAREQMDKSQMLIKGVEENMLIAQDVDDNTY